MMELLIMPDLSGSLWMLIPISSKHMQFGIYFSNTLSGKCVYFLQKLEFLIKDKHIEFKSYI